MGRYFFFRENPPHFWDSYSSVSKCRWLLVEEMSILSTSPVHSILRLGDVRCASRTIPLASIYEPRKPTKWIENEIKVKSPSGICFSKITNKQKLRQPTKSGKGSRNPSVWVSDDADGEGLKEKSFPFRRWRCWLETIRFGKLATRTPQSLPFVCGLRGWIGSTRGLLILADAFSRGAT